jgi:hypothetical protein
MPSCATAAWCRHEARRPRAVLALLLAMLAGAGPATAQNAYRWVDEQGRVQYSDQPPPRPSRSSRSATSSPTGQRPDPFLTRKAAASFP